MDERKPLVGTNVEMEVYRALELAEERTGRRRSVVLRELLAAYLHAVGYPVDFPESRRYIAAVQVKAAGNGN